MKLAILLLLLVANASGQEQALRQSQWYFWTEICGSEFRTAMNNFHDCIVNMFKEDASCEEVADDASRCYEPFESFSCQDEKMTREVRLIGRREKNIQKTILCKMDPSQRGLCLTMLNLKSCRPEPDISLNEICKSVAETNKCFFDQIDEHCDYNDTIATKKYLEVVSKEVICSGYIPSAATTDFISFAVYFASFVLVCLSRKCGL